MRDSQSSGYVLKFISGKYQGGEFPLEMNSEIIIGRSSDLDMVLVEDMVSRRHAKISTYNSELFIEDFGSTNGTFVNGEKVSRARLKEGDRVLIGTNIIKLVHRDRPELEGGGATLMPQPGGPMGRPLNHTYAGGPTTPDQHTRGRMATGGQTMTGSISGLIEEVPLPDLLQLFSTSRKSGVLVIHGDDLGKVFLRDGRVFFASINDETDIDPYKSFYRMMGWRRGTFSLEHPSDDAFDNEINESVEGLMMEGMRILDEIQNLGPDVPEMDDALTVVKPLMAPLRSLSPDQLDVFQLVLNYGTVSGVLNKSVSSDVETMQGVIHLIRNDYVTAGR